MQANHGYAKKEWFKTKYHDPATLFWLWGDTHVYSEAEFRDALVRKQSEEVTLASSEFEPWVSQEDTLEMIQGVQEEIEKWNLCQGVVSREYRNIVKTWDPIGVMEKLLNVPWTEQVSCFTYKKNGKCCATVYASPEIHMEAFHGDGEDCMRMRPIAGTKRVKDLLKKIRDGWDIKSWKRDFIENTIEFLRDPKELYELMMVLDEHMKMCAQFCRSGCIRGPYLRVSGAAVHTEFEIIWVLDDMLNILSSKLSKTLYASTLIGWPRKSAFEVIAKLEKSPRYSYGGLSGIYTPDELDDRVINPFDPDNIRRLFTTINIRGFEMELLENREWKITGRTGAGVVSLSDPESEIAEMDAKMKGQSDAVSDKKPDLPFDISAVLSTSEHVWNVLNNRRKLLGRFYKERLQWNMGLHDDILEKLKDKKIIIIDCDDEFSYMIRLILNHAWADVDVVGYEKYHADFIVWNHQRSENLTILWPGPGDVNDASSPKMKKLSEITQNIIKWDTPVFWVCLWHQMLAREIAWSEAVRPLKKSNQGIGQEAVYFLDDGRESFRMASYNSHWVDAFNANVEDMFDMTTEGEWSELNVVHMEMKPQDGFARIGGVQKHLESAVSPEWAKMLCKLVSDLF